MDITLLLDEMRSMNQSIGLMTRKIGLLEQKVNKLTESQKIGNETTRKSSNSINVAVRLLAGLRKLSAEELRNTLIESDAILNTVLPFDSMDQNTDQIRDWIPIKKYLKTVLKTIFDIINSLPLDESVDANNPVASTSRTRCEEDVAAKEYIAEKNKIHIWRQYKNKYNYIPKLKPILPPLEEDEEPVSVQNSENNTVQNDENVIVQNNLNHTVQSNDVNRQVSDTALNDDENTQNSDSAQSDSENTQDSDSAQSDGEYTQDSDSAQSDGENIQDSDSAQSDGENTQDSDSAQSDGENAQDNDSAQSDGENAQDNDSAQSDGENAQDNDTAQNDLNHRKRFTKDDIINNREVYEMLRSKLKDSPYDHPIFFNNNVRLTSLNIKLPNGKTVVKPVNRIAPLVVLDKIDRNPYPVQNKKILDVHLPSTSKRNTNIHLPSTSKRNSNEVNDFNIHLPSTSKRNSNKVNDSNIHLPSTSKRNSNEVNDFNIHLPSTSKRNSNKVNDSNIHLTSSSKRNSNEVNDSNIHLPSTSKRYSNEVNDSNIHLPSTLKRNSNEVNNSNLHLPSDNTTPIINKRETRANKMKDVSKSFNSTIKTTTGKRNLDKKNSKYEPPKKRRV